MKKKYILPKLKFEEMTLQKLCNSDYSFNVSTNDWEHGTGEDIDSWDEG